MLAIATTDTDLDRLMARLRGLDVRSVEIVEPSTDRRVLIAELEDEASSEGRAVELRRAGEMAVTRPMGGARLEAWRRDTAPVTIAGRVTVCLAWSEHDRRGLPGLVELGPGGFGSGHHPTTRLIVEQLVERIRGGERVLDIGCGSGVLGLCALELGAREVVAIDLKEAAVSAAARSAHLNDRSGTLHARIAPLEAGVGSFDVVLANVARAGIVELAPEISSRTASDGWTALSGISESQCDQVAGFLRPLVEIERRTEGDWTVLVMRQPSTG